MRLGGPVFGVINDPQQWIQELKRHGYRAAYAPVDHTADDAMVKAYVDAAERADIVIAEVGAWSNPLGPDEVERKAAQDYCKVQLELADRIGARCCVNISGSRGAQWDGPDPRNLTQDTFDCIVAVVRDIIDAVKPTRTFFTLETMQWMYPDSPDSYLRLMTAIDRPQFGVHLDPTNLINCPERYFNSGELIKECFRMLGPHIKSCHAKDIRLDTRATVHLDEVRPGLGNLDYPVFLSELNCIEKTTPLMLEHLIGEEEYREAADYIRRVAKVQKIDL